MLRGNANTHENNFQQHVSSIRQLKNKLFTDEKDFDRPEKSINNTKRYKI